MAAAATTAVNLKPSPFRRRSLSACHSESSLRRSGIHAIFWGSRKASEATTRPVDFSLGDFMLTSLAAGDATAVRSLPAKLSVSMVSSKSEIPPHEWDACALEASGPEKFNPFLSHGFLSSLEESRSAVKETGWVPRHIVAKDDADNVIATPMVNSCLITLGGADEREAMGGWG